MPVPEVASPPPSSVLAAAAAPGRRPPGESAVVATRPRPDLWRTLGVHRHGGGDPSFRVDPDGSVWRACRTPDGPATVRIAVTGFAQVTAVGWGDGARWVLDRLPALLGEADDLSGFDPCHPVLAAASVRLGGWRIGRSGLLLDALVPAILEQKVTSVEALRSWRELVWRFGEPAPGPRGSTLRLPPDARGWAMIPTWEWHRAGVGPQRATTIVRAARVADRLQSLVEEGSAALDVALRSLPGIGVWTSAEVRQRVCGDADAVSVGDYNLPKLVGFALAGERTDDDGMLALLARWPGHRYRVTRLLELSGLRAPRHGPRMPIRDFRRI